MVYQAIYKYPVSSVPGTFDHQIPKGAVILCVQIQRGLPQIWAIVNPNAKEETRGFIVAGTGQRYSQLSESKYIGTFQEKDGALVWHVFEG